MVYELGGQQIWVRVLALLLSNFVTFSKSVSPSLAFFICKINSNYPIRLLWILNNYSMKSLIIVSKYGIPSKAGFVNSNFLLLLLLSLSYKHFYGNHYTMLHFLNSIYHVTLPQPWVTAFQRFPLPYPLHAHECPTRSTIP